MESTKKAGLRPDPAVNPSSLRPSPLALRPSNNPHGDIAIACEACHTADDWRTRLVNEKADNDTRLTALRSFLSGPGPTALQKHHVDVLRKQEEVMTEFSGVLGQRLALCEHGVEGSAELRLAEAVARQHPHHHVVAVVRDRQHPRRGLDREGVAAPADVRHGRRGGRTIHPPRA